MRRVYWIVLGGILVVTSVVVIFVGSVYLRIEPLPNRDQLVEAERRAWQYHDAERRRDLPSYENLPAIEPMKIENALILQEIGGLFPGNHGVGNGLTPGSHPERASHFLPIMNFRAEYVSEEEARGCQESNPYRKDGSPLCFYSWSGMNPPVIVEVNQFPNEAWPRYYAKWSPNPGILQQGDPGFDITQVTKFKNRVVMNRQYHLWFYWPSGRNLVSVMYSSKIIQEEFLRRYLEKYPSSL